MSMRWLVPSAVASVRRLTSESPLSATYSKARSSRRWRGDLSSTLRQCTMWYMKPVQVHIDVQQQREQVYDFLDVMANHEPFTDHMLQDWRYAGPPSGVGAKAQVTVKAAGRSETVDIEVVAGERPRTIVEQNVGAGGRRVGTG